MDEATSTIFNQVPILYTDSPTPNGPVSGYAAFHQRYLELASLDTLIDQFAFVDEGFLCGRTYLKLCIIFEGLACAGVASLN